MEGVFSPSSCYSHNGTDTKKATYVYDTANQLVRENNPSANKSWVWEYDNAGNILSRTEYNYSTGTLGAALDTVNYVYGNSNWGDLLTSYDGQTISYDEIGNPTSIGGRHYTWEHGRRLASLSENGTTWTYTYNTDGMRIGRTNGTDSYTYYYNGDLLRYMSIGDTSLYFVHDPSGQPVEVTVRENGTASFYYYLVNAMGDVNAIVDKDGNVVVEYVYDAWGNILSTSGSMADTLGQINPFRYRGYVYDSETDLYYLQSRYYDPEMGRFINADALTSTGQGVLSNNMYAYCLNNPINRTDVFGSISIWYYLIIDHDMGFIHRLVQAEIMANYGGNIHAELILTGFGRADLVDVSTCVVWEVKHAGQNKELRSIIAKAQATKYIGGSYEDIVIVGLGSANAFSGKFIVQCMECYYEVSYTTPDSGVVLYEVQEVNNFQGEPAYAYYPKKSEQENQVKHGSSYIGVPVASVSIGYFVGGVGNRMPLAKNLFS